MVEEKRVLAKLSTYLSHHNVFYDQWPEKWIDGIFLGNGDIGAMIWGNGAPLKISLDKIDFWENRMGPEGKFGDEYNWENMKKLVLAKDNKTLRRKFEYYGGKDKKGGMPLQPTKLPVPRMELLFPKPLLSPKIEIDLYNAMIKGSFIINTSISFNDKDNQSSQNRVNLKDNLIFGKKEIKINLKGFIDADKNLLLIDFTPDLNDIVNNKQDSQEKIEITKSFSSLIPEISCSYNHLDDYAKKTMSNWGYLPLYLGKYSIKQNEGDKEHIIYCAYQEIPEDQGGLLIGWSVFIIKNTYRLVVFMATHNHLEHYKQNYTKDLKINPINTGNNKYSRLLNHLFAAAINSIEPYFKLTFEVAINNHLVFWHNYWKKSMVFIPDNILENLYYIELYKLACNTRKGKFPTPLQGVWTLDGGMPPWLGDYHIDMNIQEAYWPIFSSNRLDEGEPLFRVMSSLIPKFEKYAREFYNSDGILTTCSISLNGENLHGYYNTEIWPGNSAWLAHMYWLQWLYTKDLVFLKEQAFPIMYKSMQLYESLLEKNEYGEYYIPLSSSPEYLENQIDAWGKNTTVDLALIKWLCESLIEIVKILKNAGDSDIGEKYKDDLLKWDEINENLVYFPAGFDGLHVFEGQPYDIPHRHMSHLFPIHPLHLITVEKDEDDRFLIKRSLRRLREIGMWGYTGWTLPWLSIFANWANESWLAYRWIREYLNFIKDNSMHINGDYKDVGLCVHIYEPMTLEAGFTFIYAINEFLLKSWGETIRIAEYLPRSWHSIEFYRLRAEGAFLVSAKIKDKKLQWIIIESEAGGVCKIKNSFIEGKREFLNVYKFPSENPIIEHSNGLLLSFETKKNDFYIIITEDALDKTLNPYKSFINLLDCGKPSEIETLFDLSEFSKDELMDYLIEKNMEYKQSKISPIFCGNHWFGYQKHQKNPYLP